MMGRFMSIWFPYLLADRAIQVKPELKDTAFVSATPAHGRMVVQAASIRAVEHGISKGSVVADARAILPGIKIFQYKEGIIERLLEELAGWALRFTPIAAVDLPDGLILDISGCPHLWGGEASYLKDIVNKLAQRGYHAKAAIADTAGVAWAVARYGQTAIVEPAQQLEALGPLPPAAFRLEPPVLERMQKLGFYKIGMFINMPHTVLRRRFGKETIHRINQVLGHAAELLTPVQPATVFQARLPCLEPVRTRGAIDIALQTTLEQLSGQLTRASKGLRNACFKSYRLDGKIQQVDIGTNRPVRNVAHLLKLFEQKIEAIRPGLGIELFLMEAPVVEDLSVQQESLWAALGNGDENSELSNLLDRIAGKVGDHAIHRYLPVEHYWPERSVKKAASIFEEAETPWRVDKLRPVSILNKPERIEVTVPIPDYPPMMFIHKGITHKIKKADGPERIAREWWQDKELPIRDYYRVEDESGARYWLFRSGTYDQEEKPVWFLHGFFA